MNTKRFAALVLAAALAVCSVSGCTFGEKTRIAATYSGGEVPAGVYIAHQLTALNEAYYKVPDMSKNVLEQEIDGAKAADWINNRAAELTRTFVAIESEFDRLGLTLDPETAAAATQGLRQSWESESDRMEKAGIGYSSVEAINLNAAKSQLVFSAYYGEGGEFAVSEEDYRAFYEENYRRVLMLVLSKTYDQATGTAFDEAGAAAQQELIESYFERSRAGEPLFDLIVARDEAIHSTLDSGNAHTHGPLVEAEQISLVYRENTNYPQALRDQIFANDTMNVPETYEDDNYGILFERRSLMEDESAYQSAKLSMLPLMKQDEYNEKLLAAADSLGISFNQDALKAFKLDKLMTA